MSQQRKQRLVGFLLLLSLAVILVPLVFDGSGYRERKLQEELPKAPEYSQLEPFEPVNQPLPDTRAFAEPRPQPEDPKAADSQPIPAAEAVASDAPATVEASDDKRQRTLSIATEKPVLDQQGVPVAWTIQLASFKDGNNARALRARLLKSGYKAYIRRKDALSKVYVGPDIQRSELEKLRQQLKREFKLDGLILRFTTG